MNRRAAVALIAVLTTAACGGVTTPTGPAPTPQTTVHEDTLTVNGANIFPFSTDSGGTVTATVLAVNPAATVIGVALGVWDATTGTCQISITKDNAVQGSVITATASAIGNYCLRVYDPGTLTGPTDWQMSILIP
jgi:hypothetical protein